ASAPAHDAAAAESWASSSPSRSDHSSGYGDPVAEKRADRARIVCQRATRKRLEEDAAVGAAAQPRVEDRDDAAVRVAADQAPEPLPELQDGGRQRVLAEPVAARPLDRLAAGLVQGVAGCREGKLVDHEQRQRLPGDVDA